MMTQSQRCRQLQLQWLPNVCIAATAYIKLFKYLPVSFLALRFVTLHMDKSKNLGIKLFGGNKVGIYVHDVAPGSPSDHAGIRKGDLILEYNGVDLSGVTAEQAANEISKLTDTVTMLVQNKLQSEWESKPSQKCFYIYL